MRMALRCLSALALVACKQEPKGIRIDGELHEPAWNARAKRGVFVDATGAEARPYSEIRLLAEGPTVYIALYAADQDIRSSDAFELRAGTLVMHLPPRDARVPANVQIAVDLDGTLDRPDDEDEEWVIEMAAPLAAVGQPTFDARRCDHPKAGGERCGQWTGSL